MQSGQRPQLTPCGAWDLGRLCTCAPQGGEGTKPWGGRWPPVKLIPGPGCVLSRQVLSAAGELVLVLKRSGQHSTGFNAPSLPAGPPVWVHHFPYVKLVPLLSTKQAGIQNSAVYTWTKLLDWFLITFFYAPFVPDELDSCPLPMTNLYFPLHLGSIGPHPLSSISHHPSRHMQWTI